MTSLIYDLRTLDHAVSRGNGILKAKDMAQLDQARGLILAAEQQAEEIRQKAQEHYEAEKERGYQEGHRAAEEAALSRILSEQIYLDGKLNDLEADLADLIKSCVRKLVSTFDDFALAEAAATSALSKMRNEKQIQFYLPPGLMEAFSEVSIRLEALFPETKAIELIEDATLEAPDIIVESRIGRIECGFGANIDAIYTIIDAVVANLTANPSDNAAGENP